MGVVYVVQHGEKASGPGDPGLSERGRAQAERTADWLRQVGLTRVFASPLRRALETAEVLASVAGGSVEVDDRLRERMNWDAGQGFEDFAAEWDKSVRDRDFVPSCGDSSNNAARRFRAFLEDWETEGGPIAVATHGGVTVDLLRSVLGDAALPPRLLDKGVPPCAVTVLDGLAVIEIASVAHLDE